MSATLTKDIVLIHSFKIAAFSPAPKMGVVRIPAPANSYVEASTGDSIFRTTDK